MIVSLSAVVFLAIIVFFLIKYAALHAWKAAMCILLGFFLAATPVAPYITAACAAIARFLAGLDA